MESSSPDRLVNVELERKDGRVPVFKRTNDAFQATKAWGSVNGLWKGHCASNGHCQNWIQFSSNTITKYYGHF